MGGTNITVASANANYKQKNVSRVTGDRNITVKKCKNHFNIPKH